MDIHRHVWKFKSDILNDIERISQNSVKYAKETLQPEINKTKYCVAMITVIVAEFDWITIPCNEKNSNLVLCYQKLSQVENISRLTITPFKKNSLLKMYGCLNGQLFIDGHCITFTWYEGLQMKSNLLNSSENKNLALPSNKSLFQYFTAIQQFFYYPIEFSVQSSLLNDYISFQAVKSVIYEDLKWIKTDMYPMFYEMKGYMLEEMIMNIQIHLHSIDVMMVLILKSCQYVIIFLTVLMVKMRCTANVIIVLTYFKYNVNMSVTN